MKKNLIEVKIEAKRQELLGLDIKARETKSYIQGLEDALSGMVTFERGSETPRAPRGDGYVSDVKRILTEYGPLHITKIMDLLGDKAPQSKLSLTGTLGRYSRAGNTFRKVGPNVFSLIEPANNYSTQREAPRLIRRHSNDTI